MPTIEERLLEAVKANYDSAEVKISSDPERLDFSKDEYGQCWVYAQVLVSPMDLCPNPNPVYSVWECQDWSAKHDWSEMSDWRLDEIFQCDSDDDSGTAARRLAHDRAKYLRKTTPSKYITLVHAVRRGIEPPPLLPHTAKNLCLPFK